MTNMLYLTCISDKGLIRNNNEDNYLVNGGYKSYTEDSEYTSFVIADLSEASVFGVFDGMGGEQNGEYASFEAAKALSTFEKGNNVTTTEYLEDAVAYMNNAVCMKGDELKCSRMGSTAVFSYVEKNMLTLCNIGDSRGYRLRDGELFQLSLDHSEAINIEKPSRKPALTQHLGISPDDFEIVPHVISSELKAGDVYILCSDGLTDMVSTSDIKKIIMESNDSNTICNGLVNAALNNGGRDNVTVLVAVAK